MGSYRATRRALLAGAGASGSALVAGCLGERTPDEDEASEPVVDVAETTEGETDPTAWADVEKIRFDGYVGGWVGAAPAAIDRAENPTLVLFEGREYDLVWINRDGVHHNLAFWDEQREVVADYSTDGNEERGARETLSVTATPEMATYRCEYQPEGQRGDVEVLEEDGESR